MKRIDVQTQIMPMSRNFLTQLILKHEPAKKLKTSQNGYTVYREHTPGDAAEPTGECRFMKWFPIEDGHEATVSLAFSIKMRQVLASQQNPLINIRTPQILAISSIDNPIDGEDSKKLQVVVMEHINPKWDPLTRANVILAVLNTLHTLKKLPTDWLDCDLGRGTKTAAVYTQRLVERIDYVDQHGLLTPEEKQTLVDSAGDLDDGSKISFVHGDLSRDNITIKENEVIVFDLEKAGLGNHLEDVARLINGIIELDYPTGSKLIEAYGDQKDALSAFRIYKAMYSAAHYQKKLLEEPGNTGCMAHRDYYLSLSIRLATTREGHSEEELAYWNSKMVQEDAKYK